MPILNTPAAGDPAAPNVGAPKLGFGDPKAPVELLEPKVGGFELPPVKLNVAFGVSAAPPALKVNGACEDDVLDPKLKPPLL